MLPPAAMIATLTAIARATRPAVLAGTLAVASALAAPGCVGYATWPPAEGQPAHTGPNAPPVTEATIAALSWVLDRAELPEPGGTRAGDAEAQPAAAFNLYRGVSRSTYEYIDRRLDAPIAPLSMATLTLPRFHVVQVRLRGATAEVDLLRPVTERPRGPEGRYPLEPLTLELTSRAGTWRVERRQRFAIGSQPAPDPVLVPAQRDAAGRLIKREGEP